MPIPGVERQEVSEFPSAFDDREDLDNQQSAVETSAPVDDAPAPVETPVETPLTPETANVEPPPVDDGLVEFVDEFDAVHRVPPATKQYLEWKSKAANTNRPVPQDAPKYQPQSEYRPGAAEVPAELQDDPKLTPDERAYRELRRDIWEIKQQQSNVSSYFSGTRADRMRENVYDHSIKTLDSLLSGDSFLKSNKAAHEEVRSQIEERIRGSVNNLRGDEQIDFNAITGIIYGDAQRRIASARKIAGNLTNNTLANAQVRQQAQKAALPAGGHGAQPQTKAKDIADMTPAERRRDIQNAYDASLKRRGVTS